MTPRGKPQLCKGRRL